MKPADLAQSVRNRLLQFSREEKLGYDFILSRYGIERFLYRLSISPYSRYFVLKGAALLLAWTGQIQRVTRDADFLVVSDSDEEWLTMVIREICLMPVPVDDAISFDLETMRVENIRIDQIYGGYSFKFTAHITQTETVDKCQVWYSAAERRKSIAPGGAFCAEPGVVDIVPN